MFTVILHHLSPDAKEAGVQFPDQELRLVPEAKLRILILSLAALASKAPAATLPELRIQGPLGRFTVQLTEGKLRFNSWSTRVGGFDLTTDQIIAIITGTEDALGTATAPATATTRPTARTAAARDEEIPEDLTISPGVKIGFLVVVIAVINVITFWTATRPPENPFLPAYTVLEPEPSERLLKDVTGTYVTGTGARPGDRRLTIEPDGRLRSVKLGKGGVVLETTEMTSQPVQSAGHAALLTDGRALLEFVDSVTITLYGDTYRRKGP